MGEIKICPEFLYKSNRNYCLGTGQALSLEEKQKVMLLTHTEPRSFENETKNSRLKQTTRDKENVFSGCFLC